MDGSEHSHRHCQKGKQAHRRGGSSFYASFLQSILNRKLVAQLYQDQSAVVTNVPPTTEELPTLKVLTLSSDQHGIVLPPIAQRGISAPCPKTRGEDPIPPVKGRRKDHEPPPLQKVVHPVQVQVDCVGGSHGSGRGSWDDYDFTPVYIWMPKRQQSKTATCTSQEPMGHKLNTTYLNEAIVLPGTAKDKKIKKKRRKPDTRSPSARWYGELLSEYYSDLVDLTDKEWSEILAGTNWRDIIGSRTHSRNEQARNVRDSQKTKPGKTAAAAREPSADPGRLPEGQKESEEGEEEEEEREGSEGEVLPSTSVPEGMTATAGPLQVREAKGPSGGGGGLPEEQNPPAEINHEPRTEDRDISEGPVKSWLRPPERISRYPYGNPSQPRIPRTQSVPLHPISLKSAACSSTVEALREARNASMQSAQIISVRTCALTPRTSKEDCLPPLLKPSPRTPPPTALQPIRLATTIL